jgi:hypothetical protein
MSSIESGTIRTTFPNGKLSKKVSPLGGLNPLNPLDLTFVPRVHNGVWMGLRGVDESLFPKIAPRLLGEVHGELQGPTAIYTDRSKTEGLVEIGIFLDDRDSF